MIDIFYVIIANLFRTFVIYRLMSVFFKQKKNAIICGSVYLGYFLVTAAIYLRFHNVFCNIASNVIGIFILTLLYESKILKKIVLTCMIYLLNMACDGLVFIVLTNYKIGNEVSELYGILTSVLLFFIELLIENFFGEKEEFAIPFNKSLLLLCVPLLSAVMIVSKISHVSSRITTAITMAGILMINVFLFYLYNSILNYYKEKYSVVLLERQIATYENQLEVMEISRKENDALKHDMKHHIRMMRGYMKEQNWESLNKYIENMESEYLTYSRKYINSGNKEIDSILNYMLSLAEQKVEHISYEINIPEQLVCDILAINIMLGNLLENAIDAARDIKNGFLRLNMNVKQGILYIDISNSYSGILKMNNKKFLTTKNNPKLHGMGLENVRKIVEENNGVLDIDYSDNTFNVRILFYLNTK